MTTTTVDRYGRNHAWNEVVAQCPSGQQTTRSHPTDPPTDGGWILFRLGGCNAYIHTHGQECENVGCVLLFTYNTVLVCTSHHILYVWMHGWMDWAQAIGQDKHQKAGHFWILTFTD
jgi:hypothetical protein